MANTQPETGVITLDLKLLLGPVVMLLSALIISGSILYAANMLKGNLGSTTTATDTTGTTTDTGTATVGIDQVKGLFDTQKLTFGDRNSSLIFVEVSDPSCPYCHIASGLNPELNAQVGDRFKMVADGGTYLAPVPEMRKLVDQGKAAFVWLYSNGHGNGEVATKALYCAQERGVFWQVHDLLMTDAGYNLINNNIKNDNANAPQLAEFTKSVMDATELTNCIQSGKYDGIIASDQATSRSLGVSGTPGFFVNATNYAGAYSFTDMQATIDQYL